MITYFLIFFTYAIIGWFFEVTVIFVSQGHFVNRGFLIGPWIPIYGFGGLFIYALLSPFENNPFVLFLLALIICTILEYVTSYVLEKIFHARWWDYSQKPLNINGRVCLQNMIVFGLLGVVATYFINPYLLKFYSLFSDTVLLITVIILSIAFICDTVLSFKVLSSIKGYIGKLEKKDSTEEISNKIKSILVSNSTYFKRLLNAYPDFKFNKEYLEKIRERLKKFPRLSKIGDAISKNLNINNKKDK